VLHKLLGAAPLALRSDHSSMSSFSSATAAVGKCEKLREQALEAVPPVMRRTSALSPG